MTKNPQARLILGENLEVLETLLKRPTPRFRLIYLDPPFDTGLNWKTREGVQAYRDQFTGDAFLEMMDERLRLVHRLLTEDGSLFLHCDYRRAPHLQLLCDSIFGPGARESAKAPGFRNEIIWSYGLGGSSPRYYPRKHDNLYWYTKSSTWIFEPPLVPATSQRLKGKLKKAPDTWSIPTLNNMAAERTGYPTQKPLALLDRIVAAHSEPGDWVGDFFCGSGTTLHSALRLGRNALGCDASNVAIQQASERLKKAGFACVAEPPISSAPEP
ncbi:MAG: site-specific DNA-methyltransferase [Myxococcota bacterium]|nr:site-specific DNA-methyltransferase [Myxococcota bacterium]